jgi:hypothetical protein
MNVERGFTELNTFLQDALRSRVNTAYMQIHLKELELLASTLQQNGNKQEDLLEKVMFFVNYFSLCFKYGWF